MPRSASAADAEQELLRHCHTGLEVSGLQARLLHSLRRLMSVDAAFFATADPETLLFTSAHAEDPLGSATPLFLDNEYSGNDVNRFATLATSATHVASLDEVTRLDRPASPRYRDIMRPLGLGDELRAALVVGSQCWGYLCLHREDAELGFTSAEAALIARIGPHIAHALRQAVLLADSRAEIDGDPARPGVVLLGPDLSVVAITPEAEHLLTLIDEAGSPRLPLPVAVYAAAAALGPAAPGSVSPGSAAPASTSPGRSAPGPASAGRSAPDPAAGPAARGRLPSTRVRTTVGGWLHVHASRLHGPPGEERIAVVVEQAEAADTAPLLLSAHGLTRREAEVARLVLRGESTRAIVGRMHISQHTVQDHLKSVFDKVGVRSRRELVARMLGNHRPDAPHSTP